MNRIKLELVSFNVPYFFLPGQSGGMETDLTEQCQGEAGQVPGGARRPQAMKVAGWRGGDFQWIEVAGLLFIWEIRSLKKLRRGASGLQTAG